MGCKAAGEEEVVVVEERRIAVRKGRTRLQRRRRTFEWTRRGGSSGGGSGCQMSQRQAFDATEPRQGEERKTPPRCDAARRNEADWAFKLDVEFGKRKKQTRDQS